MLDLVRQRKTGGTVERAGASRRCRSDRLSCMNAGIKGRKEARKGYKDTVPLLKSSRLLSEKKLSFEQELGHLKNRGVVAPPGEVRGVGSELTANDYL